MLILITPSTPEGRARCYEIVATLSVINYLIGKHPGTEEQKRSSHHTKAEEMNSGNILPTHNVQPLMGSGNKHKRLQFPHALPSYNLKPRVPTQIM